jgi:hypothetical protein
MQSLRADVPWIIEICPASALKKEGLYIPYKGKGAKKQAVREHILDHFERKVLDLPKDIRGRALQNSDGDALDSIIAAYSVFSVLHTLVPGNVMYEPYINEGFTFM